MKRSIFSKLGFPSFVALSFTLLAVFILAAPSGLSPHDNPAIGQPGPSLDLVQLPEVTSPDLSATGKVTLLHFWGTWCPPCRMEYPELAEMANQHSVSDDFQFVPVSCEGGSGETFVSLWRKTADYFDSENVRSVVYADPRGATRTSLSQCLKQSDLYFPTSVVIDQNGNIAGIWEGYTDTSVGEISSLLDDLLK